MCPEGKLTPEISRRYDMPVIFITIDELQEYLSAMPGPIKEQTVENLARLSLRAPAQPGSSIGRGLSDGRREGLNIVGRPRRTASSWGFYSVVELAPVGQSIAVVAYKCSGSSTGGDRVVADKLPIRITETRSAYGRQ
jgi:hypothetical protein